MEIRDEDFVKLTGIISAIRKVSADALILAASSSPKGPRAVIERMRENSRNGLAAAPLAIDLGEATALNLAGETSDALDGIYEECLNILTKLGK